MILKVSPAGFVICTLFIVCYTMAGLLGIQAHFDPIEMDTTSYLSTALDIRLSGGILSFIPNCLTGVYAQATQHPLYVLPLSVFAKPNLLFFVQVKLFTFFTGFVFLGVLYWTVSRVFDKTTALGVLALVVFNATFINLTTMVACESLLALFFVLFWGLTCLGFRDARWWKWAGVCAGLAFLTKSIGILTLPIFAVSCIAVCRTHLRAWLANRSFWCFFLAFFLTASPLLVRNMVRYGNPLYSNSSAVLWADQWTDYSEERVREGRFGMKQYLATHTPGQIGLTFWKGFLERDLAMLMDGLRPLRFWEDIDLLTLQGFETRKNDAFYVIWFIGIMSLFTLGMVSNRGAPEFWVTISTLFFFMVFVAFYSKVFSVPPTRLLYCTFFPILVYAVRGMHLPVTRRKLLGASLVIFLCAYAYGMAKHYDWKQLDPMKSFRTGPLIRLQLEWIRDNFNKGEKIFGGSVIDNLGFYLKDEIRADVRAWPKADSMEALEDYIRRERIEYGILDLATALYNPQVFKSYFHVTERGLFPKKELPALFRPLPTPKDMPPFFLLYKFQTDTDTRPAGHGE